MVANTGCVTACHYCSVTLWTIFVYLKTSIVEMLRSELVLDQGIVYVTNREFVTKEQGEGVLRR